MKNQTGIGVVIRCLAGAVEVETTSKLKFCALTPEVVAVPAEACSTQVSKLCGHKHQLPALIICNYLNVRAQHKQHVCDGARKSF